MHPSRVVRFLGNACPDPSFGPWSDSVLQVLYDVALTQAGATSLMHEAKVDVVTVANLSEHLSSAATTAQLSARFAYAAAMKSPNNLLLLGDGESSAEADGHSNVEASIEFNVRHYYKNSNLYSIHRI